MPQGARLYELVQRLLSERNPGSLLRTITSAARELTVAPVAAVGITAGDGGRDRVVIDPPGTSNELLPTLDDKMHRRLEKRQAIRTEAALIAPLATTQHVYGWLTLSGKPGGFEDSDEQLALTLGAVGGTAYENTTLIAHDDEMEFALSVARVGLSYRDIDADYLFISRSLAELLGLPPGTRTIARKDFLAGMHPDDRATVDATVRQAVQQGTEFHLEYRFNAGNRGWRWFRSNGRVRINLEGRPRIFSAIADITERRSLESQLQHAQKMDALGQLAGGVAHDFNNFLTANLGYARFLHETVPDPAHRRDAEEIVKAAERAASLTKQLLAFGRGQVIETDVINVNSLVVDMADMLRRIIGEDVELTTKTTAEMPTVRAGRGQVEQVVMNLVVNARDAIEGVGAIHIETEDATVERRSAARPTGVSPGKYLVVTVTDTGSGMTDETRARLFEPFFTTKPRTQRSGLGLATVYGIVTQCGGAITVASELGHGSTFRVYLPRHEQPVQEPAAERPAVVTRGGETVLLAEDEPAVRRLAKVILERAGYKVFEAANPGEAETMAESLPAIDLLLTDVIMPGGSGPDLFRRLSPRKPGMRVLFMSGYAERELFDRDSMARSDAFIAKPFSAAALAEKVRQTLDA